MTAPRNRDPFPGGAPDDELEAIDLGASEIACAVADAWAGGQRAAYEYSERTWEPSQITPAFAAALDALELATRPSALRKVKP